MFSESGLVLTLLPLNIRSGFKSCNVGKLRANVGKMLLAQTANKLHQIFPARS